MLMTRKVLKSNGSIHVSSKKRPYQIGTIWELKIVIMNHHKLALKGGK